MSDTIKSENIKLDINKLNIGKADVSKADVSKANNIKPENLLQSDKFKNIYSYLKPVLMVLLLYLTTTMLEWFYHCKVMHNEKYDPGHIRHHKSVHADMHLDDDEFYDKDIRMSNIHSISIFAVANILYYFIITQIFQYEIPYYYVMFLSLTISLYYRIMWNRYHRMMHFKPEIFSESKNPYLRWLFKNHTIHHLQKGDSKGNFNILFPGGDHLMGTYRTKVDNVEFCKKNDVKDVCKYPEGDFPILKGFEKV